MCYEKINRRIIFKVDTVRIIRRKLLFEEGRAEDKNV
jgi:hypothetical protein